MTSLTSTLNTSLSAINDADSQIAAELAFEISPIEEVLARHGLSKAALRAKLQNPIFRQMVTQAKRVWRSDLSVKERIRLKSMVLVEDSLLELYTIFHDKDAALTGRLDAFKSLSKVATVDAPDKDGAAVGEKVTINISIPGITKPLHIEAQSHVGDLDDREAITNSASYEITDASGGG